MRYFVALWPDQDSATALAKIATERIPLARRATPILAADLHVTLAFIGALPVAHASALAAELADTSWHRSWRADKLGWFPGARVVWCTGFEPGWLRQSAANVRARLDAGQIPFDRRPWTLHLTLLRNVDCDPGNLGTLLAPFATVTVGLGAPRLAVSRARGPRRYELV